MKLFHHLLLILVPLVSTLRATQVRIATFNVRLGLQASSTPERVNTEAVLARINADIVGLQEVNSSDLNNGYLADLANNLGYPHLFIPTTALDTSTRVVLLSKFPFVDNSTTSIVSPPGANDVTRAAAAAIVDVPNTTNDPVIITAHLKCCFEFDDPFRRAVEMIRIRRYLEDQQLDHNDNVFVMGDFNLLGQQTITYSSLPSGLPASFSLGNDISFAVTYDPNPTTYFSGLGIIDPGARQQDGVTPTTFFGSGSTSVLDYLLVSSSVAARNPATEVYNSNLEASFPGLPKAGSALSASSSANASDHYPVYGDFQLDDGPSFTLSSSASVLDEGAPPATLTITLDAPASQNLNITLQISDPSEASLTTGLLTIPAGQSTASTTVHPLFDKITDGSQVIQVLASAPGFLGTTLPLTIRDADPQLYRFANSSQPITEDFTNFSGTQKPAAWADGGLAWQGGDDGSGTGLGGRSYEGSLGIFNGRPSSFRTTLRNDHAAVIPALEIRYLGQHWRRSANGSPDRLEASIIRNGVPRRLPELDFTPSPVGPDARLSPPESNLLSTYLRDLNLSPGEDLELLFEMIPGTPNATESNDVFINEFHYDNSGQDAGEFIEIFVGQDYPGAIENISIQLYNGSNREAYALYSLSNAIRSFPNGPGGPRLFHLETPGIQNGSPDGIALIVDGSVREFISYEGAFTASNGIAAGVASTPVGFSQTSSTQVGQNSIARTGAGSLAEDFVWSIQPGPHTPGALNVGQTLAASPQPQGIAIDNLVVTPLIDTDGDLLPDAEEIDLGTNPFLRDSDRDGQDDFFEAVLAETNPLSPDSLFSFELTSTSENTQVSFPTLTGRSYQIETSTDLHSWNALPARAGTGAPIITSISATETLFVRVRIAIP